jgi:ribosomal protein S18 acetylase RimI-like enzyme
MNLSAEVVEIRAHRDRRIPPGALRRLFDHVGWDRPAQYEDVAAVLEAGPAVGAWCGEKLVGFARALSDGHFAAYVEDAMVHREWRGRGIGERVLSLLLVEIGDVANVSLFCERPVIGFYEASGFRRTSYVLMRRAKQT